jgi:hypothetical protein
MSEHLYEIAQQKATTGSAAGAICTIIPAALGAGIRIPEIREIWIINTGGAACEVGLGIPAAAGTGAATAATVQPLNQRDPAGHTQLATSFATTQPTAPANPYRRATMQATAGDKLPWVWAMGSFLADPGVTVPQIVIWQFSAVNNTYDVILQTAE